MQRFAYLTALAFSLVVAVGTSAAIGSTRPDDRATHGPGTAALLQHSDAVRPDDRATHGSGAVGLTQQGGTVRPDDRGTHGPGAVTFAQVTPAVQAPSVASGGSAGVSVGGFDWLDAGIGAAAAFGLGLIVAGSIVLALRRRHSPAFT